MGMLRILIVPTLRAETPARTLRVPGVGDAERRGMHSHAERRNDHIQPCRTRISSL